MALPGGTVGQQTRAPLGELLGVGVRPQSLKGLVATLTEQDQVRLDSETSDVSGGSASGEHNLRTREDNADSVRLTVVDEAGKPTEDEQNID